MAGKANDKSPKKVRLLSGGNPQIAKAEGDAPVQAWIGALEGWKVDAARWFDRLVERAVPGVQKAVKWNSPFYGVDGQSWFVGVHAFARYLKFAFFRGASLSPLPPGASKQKDVRYVDLHETDPRDDAQMGSWLRQAAALPGWISAPAAAKRSSDKASKERGRR
jgi:hypothetical protein